MNKKPKITVLMPVYNSEKYLREAIESILNQTFTDFEFLIINDGSTDNSEEIIKSYIDPRIRLVNNEKNIGQTITANKGMEIAQGEYIARMDADDISLPKRLEVQVNFMDKNPEIGIAGSWFKIFENNIKEYTKKTSPDVEKNKAILLFKSILAQPSAIIRKAMLDKYDLKYDENFKQSEDYDLWVRAIKYFPITNIKKVLLLYRKHKKNVSKVYSNVQLQCSETIKIDQLKNNLGIIPNVEEKLIHNNAYKTLQYKTDDFLNKTEEWFLKLILQNKKVKFYREPQFSQVISQRWLYICNINANYNFKIFRRFWKSNLRKKLDWTEIENWKILTRFFFKCLLKKI